MKRLDIRLNLQINIEQYTNDELMIKLIKAIDSEFVDIGLNITSFNAFEITEQEASLER